MRTPSVAAQRRTRARGRLGEPETRPQRYSAPFVHDGFGPGAGRSGTAATLSLIARRAPEGGACLTGDGASLGDDGVARTACCHRRSSLLEPKRRALGQRTAASHTRRNGRRGPGSQGRQPLPPALCPRPPLPRPRRPEGSATRPFGTDRTQFRAPAGTGSRCYRDLIPETPIGRAWLASWRADPPPCDRMTLCVDCSVRPSRRMPKRAICPVASQRRGGAPARASP